MCIDHKDQLNCTDSVHACLIDSYPTTIHAVNLCDGYEACDDGFDENCELSGLSCQVHKNRLCDDVEDCEKGGDETKYICKQVVNRTCLRQLNRGSDLPIPLEWLCDNVEDCINGIDEDKTQWKVCGAGDRQRCIEPGKECNEMLKCPGSTTKPMYVKNEESFCLPGFDPKGLHKCSVGEFKNVELVRVVDPIKLSSSQAVMFACLWRTVCLQQL